MSDFNALVRLTRAKLPTCIQEITWPCQRQGKFSLVGSIPYDLTEESKVGLPGTRISKAWDTLDEARKAVEACGVDRYQLPNCAWNKPKEA